MATTQPTSRRMILGAGVGALAGLVAHALGRPQAADAADGDPLVAGSATTASTTTVLLSLNANPAFSATSQGGTGVQGLSTSARGVLGTSDSGNGVEGRSHSAKGVYGYSDEGPGVYGYSANGAGLHGYSANGRGVRGHTEAAGFEAGVWGEAAQEAFGVLGVNLKSSTFGALGAPKDAVVGEVPPLPGFVGVHAIAKPKATALSVEGVARFSRSGRASVPAGSSSVDITVPGGVSSASLVLATPMLNRVGVYVQACVPNPATGKVRIHLSKVATSATPVAWIVLN